MLIILPCQSLEDLSLDRPNDEALQLLNGWTAMYHPALLEKKSKLPRWERAACPGLEYESPLVVLPPVSELQLTENWLEQIAEKDPKIVRQYQSVEDLAAQLLDLAEITDHGFDDEFVADFYALGYCFFMVELLTRQLRYMSNLDEYQFEREIDKAIRSYREDNREDARQHLRAAFDLLSESREYFYPVQTSIIDLMLTGRSTIGDALHREIKRLISDLPPNSTTSAETAKLTANRPEVSAETPADDSTTIRAKSHEPEKQAEPAQGDEACTEEQLHDDSYLPQSDSDSSVASNSTEKESDSEPKLTMFLPVEVLQQIAATRPDILESLRIAVQHKRLAILGGEIGHWPLPLLPIDIQLARLCNIRETYSELLDGFTPVIFARHRVGLTPALPQLLHGLGFKGVLHYTFDGSLYNSANQSKIRWKGLGGRELEALVRFPLDASQPASFLRPSREAW